MSEITADEIFGPGSRPMLAAMKAARKAIAGDAPDDEVVATGLGVGLVWSGVRVVAKVATLVASVGRS